MPSLHPSPEVALSKKPTSVPFLRATAPPAAPWYPGGVLLAASSLSPWLSRSEVERAFLRPPLSLCPSSRRGDLQRRHGLLTLAVLTRARKHALSHVVTRNLTTKSLLLACTLTSDALLSDDHSLVLFAALNVPLARFVHTCAMMLRGWAASVFLFENSCRVEDSRS